MSQLRLLSVAPGVSQFRTVLGEQVTLKPNARVGLASLAVQVQDDSITIDDTGNNNVIQFKVTKGSTYRSATVPPGTYTIDNLMTVITQALNAACRTELPSEEAFTWLVTKTSSNVTFGWARCTARILPDNTDCALSAGTAGANITYANPAFTSTRPPTDNVFSSWAVATDQFSESSGFMFGRVQARAGAKDDAQCGFRMGLVTDTVAQTTLAAGTVNTEMVMGYTRACVGVTNTNAGNHTPCPLNDIPLARTLQNCNNRQIKFDCDNMTLTGGNTTFPSVVVTASDIDDLTNDGFVPGSLVMLDYTIDGTPTTGHGPYTVASIAATLMTDGEVTFSAPITVTANAVLTDIKLYLQTTTTTYVITTAAPIELAPGILAVVKFGTGGALITTTVTVTSVGGGGSLVSFTPAINLGMITSDDYGPVTIQASYGATIGVSPAPLLQVTGMSAPDYAAAIDASQLADGDAITLAYQEDGVSKTYTGIATTVNRGTGAITLTAPGPVVAPLASITHMSIRLTAPVLVQTYSYWSGGSEQTTATVVEAYDQIRFRVSADANTDADGNGATSAPAAPTVWYQVVRCDSGGTQQGDPITLGSAPYDNTVAVFPVLALELPADTFELWEFAPVTDVPSVNAQNGVRVSTLPPVHAPSATKIAVYMQFAEGSMRNILGASLVYNNEAQPAITKTWQCGPGTAASFYAPTTITVEIPSMPGIIAYDGSTGTRRPILGTVPVLLSAEKLLTYNTGRPLMVRIGNDVETKLQQIDLALYDENNNPLASTLRISATLFFD